MSLSTSVLFQVLDLSGAVALSSCHKCAMLPIISLCIPEHNAPPCQKFGSPTKVYAGAMIVVKGHKKRGHLVPRAEAPLKASNTVDLSHNV